jgi:serine protease Do
MKKLSSWVFAMALAANTLYAQETKEKLGDYDEIIIKRKNDKDAKVTVEVRDGAIMVNGKPLADFEDENVSVRRKKVMVREGFPLSGPAYPGVPPVPPAYPGNPPIPPASAYRGFGDIGSTYEMPVNRAVLGVMTEKDEKGAKIVEISKGTAAEKAGLQVGDIIMKVDEIEVDGPESLAAAIGKYKPEDKVTLSYRRSKKNNKMTVTLGKRSPGSDYAIGRSLGEPEARIYEFRNLEEHPYRLQELERMGQELEELRMIVPRAGQAPNFGYSWSDQAPKLGVKTQDLEEGRGSKVLEVVAGSNADKAGLKVGDIITHFDGKETSNTTELTEAVRAAKSKTERISVQVLRAGKSQNLSLLMPKKIKTATL